MQRHLPTIKPCRLSRLSRQFSVPSTSTFPVKSVINIWRQKCPSNSTIQNRWFLALELGGSCLLQSAPGPLCQACANPAEQQQYGRPEVSQSASIGSHWIPAVRLSRYHQPLYTVDGLLFTMQCKENIYQSQDGCLNHAFQVWRW